MIKYQDKRPTILRIRMPKAPVQEAQASSTNTIPTSDPKSSSSPSLQVAEIPRHVAKRESFNKVADGSSTTSPTAVTSSATSPQPEPSSKRKGGNKRKFTHEYCLTCTRYGRACGGRREGKDGCAVCREPDRSKGEKLRECLWTDPGNGIFDYKTAREALKQDKAEARARRAKPPTMKRQRSNAAPHLSTPRTYIKTPGSEKTAVSQPQTSRPLNLLPPTDSGSGYVSQQARNGPVAEDELVEVYDFHSAEHNARADTPRIQDTRVHRPELTYVEIGDDQEHVSNARRSHPDSLAHYQRYLTSYDSRPLYWNRNTNTWSDVSPVSASYRNIPYHYGNIYRSAYDAPPTPPSHSSHLQDPARHSLHPSRIKINYHKHSSTPPPPPPLDTSGTPSRKWSIEGAKIKSVDGTVWRTKSWRREDGDRVEARDEDSPVDKMTKDALFLGEGNSDTSSLSTCPSMDADDNDATEVTKFALATNSTKLGLQCGTQNTTGNITTARNNDDVAPRSNTFTFPGEITIQEDEEEQETTSSSDAELSSDESKHKFLPSKLRKILSRSRVTKVIIDDDVFEIRPRRMLTSSKIQKTSIMAGPKAFASGTRSENRQRQRKKPRLPSTESENETDDEEHDQPQDCRLQEQHRLATLAPIKIKLIFNPKTANASALDKCHLQPRLITSAAAQPDGAPLTPAEDVKMDKSWHGTP